MIQELRMSAVLPRMAEPDTQAIGGQSIALMPEIQDSGDTSPKKSLCYKEGHPPESEAEIG